MFAHYSDMGYRHSSQTRLPISSGSSLRKNCYKSLHYWIKKNYYTVNPDGCLLLNSKRSTPLQHIIFVLAVFPSLMVHFGLVHPTWVSLISLLWNFEKNIVLLHCYETVDGCHCWKKSQIEHFMWMCWGFHEAVFNTFWI